MAQYYQVLSQTDKATVEELRQYYPGVVENQTVQYVINPEDHQPTFQGPQILISSDQLMVIENQSPQVIVDQSQISYQNTPFVVQDAAVEYQDGRAQQQQVYFMEEVSNGQQVPAEQQVPQQQQPRPIVLNHHLQTAPLHSQLSPGAQKTMPLQPRQQQLRQNQMQLQQTRQSLPQARTSQTHVAQPRPLQVPVQSPHIRSSPQIAQHRSVQVPTPQPKVAGSVIQDNPRGGTVPPSPVIPDVPSLHFTQPEVKQTSEISESDNQEAVALSDGTIVTLAHYKQLLEDKRQAALTIAASAVQERLESLPIKFNSPSPRKRKYNRTNSSSSGRGRGRTRNTVKNSAANNAGTQVQYSPPQSGTPAQQRYVAQQQQQVKMLNHTRAMPPIAQNQYMQQQHGLSPQEIIQQQRPVIRPQQVIQQHMQQSPQQQQQQYVIQPHPPHQQQQVAALPSYVTSSQIQQIIENTPVGEEYSDSIRMLVLLENGEQRLITFTLPKEVCTIQEILEQVGVPFHQDTKIECTETNTSGINYFVTVGNNHGAVSENQQNLDDQLQSDESSKTPTCISEIPTLSEPAGSSPTPEPPKEIPRFVPGRLAVCKNCGYLSEDFNKCLRCKRKFPEDPKSISAAGNANGKKPDLLKISQAAHDKKCLSIKTNVPGTTKAPSPKRKQRPKLVEPEPVILTLSSDEEGDDSNSKTSATEQLIQKLAESSVTLSAIRKEPSITDMKGGEKESSESPSVDISTLINCRTVRIGSYRFIPADHVGVSTSGITLNVPHPKDPNEILVFNIARDDIIKVLVNFQKIMPVVFYYVIPSVGKSIRDKLGMVEGGELYFDPLSNEEAYRRITLLPELLTDETRDIFKQIYGRPNIMDELSGKEANEILIKTCPKELTKVTSNSGFTEIKQLLIYPPGRGGLSINTEDYLCLAQDQFLNDVIIDFYLKYLVLHLPKEQQDKVHVFSTFFYKRLTTKPVKASRRTHPSELDPTLTASQKRHARVKNWTKNVNLFEKDFIVIPINENCHWFLAIICFPAMDGTYTFDGRPIKIEPKQRKKKNVTTIGNVTITTVKVEKEDKIVYEEGELSDKDEAEGDESELDSEEESEPEQPQIERSKERVPIKQSCILIFDSLAGASRSRVVATLRDYLTCEHKAKLGTDRIYTKDIVKGACPKVPQQTNFTDCGLYLLQYVEQFFRDPIKDYHIPIKELQNWFEEFVVTRKREDISLLIKDLMIEYNKDPSTLPEIQLPTQNGKLVLHNHEEEEEEEEEEFEEEEEEEEEDEHCLEEGEIPDPHLGADFQTDMDFHCAHMSSSSSDQQDDAFDTNIRPSHDNVQQSDGFIKQNVKLLRPDLSETQKKKDTMSYLKAKRINRHKQSEGTSMKKFKATE